MNAKSKSGKQEEKKNVQVFVRVRPINNAEKAARSYAVVNCNGSREIVVKERPTDKLTKTFTFDKVFGPESKQIELYKSVVHPLIDEVLAGYNCTVFAYGQTGTGKTFTMEGEKSNDSSVSWENDPLSGIIPRSLSHLFDELRTTNVEYTVRVSFLELYNEEIIDLLSPTDDTSKLKLFEDSTKKGSVIVQGLEEVIVKNKQELYKIMEKGSAKRTTAATLMNAQSSRSHTVFSITVHIKENSIEGEELLRTGKLNLVDLAGSENIGRSGAVDKRAREAGNINQSLLTLGRCITSLVEHCPHIPYRESKLTRLLQESLGGRTKTSIIATVSPAMSNLEETLSTLDYAHRAKNITNKPEVNQKLTKRALIKEYTDEIERLRRDVDALREKNGIYLAAENYTEMLTKMEQQDEEIVNKISAIKALEEKVEKFEESFTSLNMKYSKVKEVMHQTLIERDEKNFLVEKYIEREQKHMEQKRQLKETVDETVNDVGILHTKLESIRKMEEYNSNVSQMFRRNHHDKTDEFHDSIKEFQHEAINSLEQEKHLILTSSQTLSTNLDYIRRCKSQSDSCAEELQKKFVDMKKNNTDQTESVKNQREITEKFVEESESNLSDNTTVVKEFSKTVPDLLSEMKQTHKQHNDHLLDVITKLQNFDYNSSLENRNRLENIQTTLEVDIEEVRQQNIENEKSFLTMLEKTISEMENKIEQRYRESLEENKLAKEHSEVRMKHIQDLLSAETSTKEKIEQNELNIKKQYVHDKREIELMKNQFNEKNRLEKQSIGEKVKNIQDSTRVIGETIEKDKNISEQKTASFGSLKSDVPKCCEIIDNGTQQNVNLCLKMEHTLLEKINEQNKSLDNFKTVVQSFHVDEISKLEELNEALHSAQNIERELHSETSKIGDTADKCFETQAHFEHTISELLDSQKDKLTSHGDSCADYISQLVDLSDKFIHHELRRNRPTGQTPERRNWQYPQVGCLTPQEQLIQRFRREKPIIPYDEFDSDYESNGNGDREVEEDKTSEEDSCDGHSSPDSGSSLRECTSTNDITSQMSITDSSILSDTQSTTSIPKPKKTIKPRGKNFFKKPARIN